MKFKYLFLFLLTSSMAVAQKAQLKVEYTYSRPDISPFAAEDGSQPLETEKMILLTGAEGSKYYNHMSQYVDSLTSTPEGRRRLQEIQMAAWVTQNPDGSISVDKTKGSAPDKRVDLYVTKDFKNGTHTVYDRMGQNYVTYTEPNDEIKWTVTEDSTKSILGYECVKAETDYHGRHWTAWFAPEIPVGDGPWKFSGLPGLILSVESADAPFSFVANGLEMVDEPIAPVYQVDMYDKVERKKALADLEYERKHMASRMKAMGVTVVTTTKDGTPVEPPKYEKARHAIETDY